MKKVQILSLLLVTAFLASCGEAITDVKDAAVDAGSVVTEVAGDAVDATVDVAWDAAAWAADVAGDAVGATVDAAEWVVDVAGDTLEATADVVEDVIVEPVVDLITDAELEQAVLDAAAADTEETE